MSSAPGRRETAQRVFAAEFDAATLDYSESDEERAPNYVVTPTGARGNRIFFVGVLTEVEQVGDGILRARIVDPTGAFVVYAGQYQPEEMAFLDKASPPAFVAVTGKARTFSPDDSDRIYTSVRPESITEVDSETRDRWAVTTAEHTIGRAVTFATALASGQTGDELTATLAVTGVDDGLASGIPLAMDHYGTTEHYLASMSDLSLDVLRVVTGDIEEVDRPSVTPSDAGAGTVDRELLAGVTDLGVATFDVEPPASTEPAAGGSDMDASTTGESEPEASTVEEPEAATTASSTAAEPTSELDSDPGAADSAESTDGTAATSVESSTADAEEPVASTTETADEPNDDFDDDIGDFEPGSSLDEDEPEDDAGDASGNETAAESAPATEDALGEEERERIEAEYGTDFQSGTEVGGAGEAGIEPEAGDSVDGDERAAEEESAADPEREAEPESETEPEPESDTDAAAGADEAEEEAAEDVDIEAAVVEAMGELDDGDGADREELVAAIVDAHGVDPDVVEDAIQDALMSGKCYEPADGKLKPI